MAYVPEMPAEDDNVSVFLSSEKVEETVATTAVPLDKVNVSSSNV